jgi:hypothetical protein
VELGKLEEERAAEAPDRRSGRRKGLIGCDGESGSSDKEEASGRMRKQRMNNGKSLRSEEESGVGRRVQLRGFKEAEDGRRRSQGRQKGRQLVWSTEEGAGKKGGESGSGGRAVGSDDDPGSGEGRRGLLWQRRLLPDHLVKGIHARLSNPAPQRRGIRSL